ncbi:MAG TPA: cytosine permease [Steroidobacteraceae bacterium]|nr:cytosine permease [Steroidobacteraceae bacterium]
MSNREQPTRLESSTIQPIAADARHGNARDLFTVWFGSNLMLLTIVTGGLAVTVFKLSFLWAVIGLLVGNLVGAVFMALHSAQGPTLGVPQMLQTRGQFGSLGSLLVVGIVIIMYVGFLASNLVVGAQALASIAPGLSDTPSIVLLTLLSAVAAIYGYDLIHSYARVMTYASGLVLLLTFAWILWVHGLPADFLSRNALHASGLLGTVSTAALWQIAYAPYVSDYSRYMPQDTGARDAFWASYWGCTLGSLLPMVLGAAVGLAVTDGSLVGGLAQLTRGIAPLVLGVFSIGITTSNAMNLYCAALSSLTFGQTVLPRWSPGPKARTVSVVLLCTASLVGALLGRRSFLDNYTDFILLLLYVLVPWTAINLVDYYLLCHGSYHVPSFLRRDGGVYGRVNGVAVACYVIGILVQLPFVANPLYTGSAARAMGGIDLSWIVGLALTSPLYYWLARRSRARAGARLAAERLQAPSDALVARVPHEP